MSSVQENVAELSCSQTSGTGIFSGKASCKQRAAVYARLCLICALFHMHRSIWGRNEFQQESATLCHLVFRQCERWNWQRDKTSLLCLSRNNQNTSHSWASRRGMMAGGNVILVSARAFAMRFLLCQRTAGRTNALSFWYVCEQTTRPMSEIKRSERLWRARHGWMGAKSRELKWENRSLGHYVR